MLFRSETRSRERKSRDSGPPLCTSAGGSRSLRALQRGASSRAPGLGRGQQCRRGPPLSPGDRRPRGRGGRLGSVLGPAYPRPGRAAGPRLVWSRRVRAGQGTRLGPHRLWRPGGLARLLQAAPRLPAGARPRQGQGRAGWHQVWSLGSALGGERNLWLGPRGQGSWSLSLIRGPGPGLQPGRDRGPSRGPGPGSESEPGSGSALGS